MPESSVSGSMGSSNVYRTSFIVSKKSSSFGLSGFWDRSCVFTVCRFQVMSGLFSYLIEYLDRSVISFTCLTRSLGIGNFNIVSYIRY